MKKSKRSDFEDTFAKKYPALKYEPFKVSYEVVSKHNYTPDFVSPSGKYYLETKGRFYTRHDANKYVHIRNCLPKGVELIFIFMDPKTPMPGARRRKNGTKFNVSEWAEKNGFKWSTIDKVKKEWLK